MDQVDLRVLGWILGLVGVLGAWNPQRTSGTEVSKHRSEVSGRSVGSVRVGLTPHLAAAGHAEVLGG